MPKEMALEEYRDSVVKFREQKMQEDILHFLCISYSVGRMRSEKLGVLTCQGHYFIMNTIGKYNACGSASHSRSAI